MKLSQEQLADFHRNGVIAIEDAFTVEEVEAIIDRLPTVRRSTCRRGIVGSSP